MCLDNYFVYHLHSDYSSCTTNIDSATKIDMYIDRAKELGITSLCFSEHGNIFNWIEKKNKIEKAGMKYVHGVEAYITESITEKVRDNYHCVLIAKNYDGVKEINRLVSGSYNREDGHFYYVPRILYDDLVNTSDNIIITTACVGGIMCKNQGELRDNFIEFLHNNNHRCFLEIQHHKVEKQIEHNRYLYEISQKYDIPLIAGTDTHSLNEELAEARIVLQQAKGIHFADEEGWDLTFKTYDELKRSYANQKSLPMDIVEEAIQNTNKVSDMVEEFTIDRTPKYPKLYEDSMGEFRKACYDAIENHPYALKNHTRQELIDRVEKELLVYEKTNTIDFMLFQTMLRTWEHENGIFVGPGRGSVTGSMIAYLLGVTEMDSIRFKLNMFRFLNTSRVSQADVDSDYFEPDRNRSRKFLLEYPKIKSAEIITFGTIGTKGGIDDIGRALGLSVEDRKGISKRCTLDENKKDIPSVADLKEYPQLFKYINLVNGVIVNMGTHAAGVLCATEDIESEIGLCTSSNSKYKISCLDMYGLDDMAWTKLDLLGLDSIGLINETCKLAGIDKINPDNIDLEDLNVWKSIRDDTTGIFQWGGDYASQTLRDLFSDSTLTKIKESIPNIKMLELFSFGNALIRPCGASIRKDAVIGNFKKTGIKDIDDLLASELNYCIIQEDIMLFLMKFCGFSLGEADLARKKIAKKLGTEELLPEIEKRFYETSQSKYNLSDEKCAEIIDPILQCILDATRYAFSKNHSDSYSFIGYANGYLRYYYPLEFITTCFNVWTGNEDKTKEISDYAKKKKISINPPKFRHSKSAYYMDKETNSIYKGIESIKFCNSIIADDMYKLKDNKYNSFIELLYDLKSTSVNARQLGILIKLDFFSEFGNAKTLLKIVRMFEIFKNGESKQIAIEKVSADETISNIVKRYSRATPKTYMDLEVGKILSEIESFLFMQLFDDFTIKEKALFQEEYIGSMDIFSGIPEDRTKLIILDVRPIRTKDKSRIWAYALTTMSIGTGKTSEVLVYSRVFERNELVKYNLIRVSEQCFKKEEWNGKTSWYLNKYKQIDA